MANNPDQRSDSAQYKTTGTIAWFARNPVAANLLFISIIILGVMSFYSLRKEVFPALEPRYIIISVSYESGSAEQTEKDIAIKIEHALETVFGIKRIVSKSTAYGCKVTIEKAGDYSLNTLFADIKNKVDSIHNFPRSAEKPILEKIHSKEHAIWVQISGDTSRPNLQRLAEKIKTALLAKPAIHHLSIAAKSNTMISIEVDENKLQTYGLTFSDIQKAINQESVTPLTTQLRNKQKNIYLNAASQAYHVDDFSMIPLITTQSGVQLTLGDIAVISDTFEDNILTLSRYNQQNSTAIHIVIENQGDITQIVEQTNQVIKEWQEKGLIPSNVELTTWLDNSQIIQARLSLLAKNALTGIILVFILLALFLHLRLAFFVAIGLPFIFFGTLYFMGDTFAGLTINQMTTFGFIMALGIVVDDAVVISESIYATRQKYGDTVESTIRGTHKVSIPTTFGVLTTIAAFLALANISGLIGKVFSQFTIVVTICLLLSLIEFKLILPAHLANINTHRTGTSGPEAFWCKIQHYADKGLTYFNHYLYQPSLQYALKFRYAVIFGFITLLIFVISLPFTGQIRTSFFPDISDDVISVQLSMQTDTSYGQTHTNLLKLESSAIQAANNLAKKYNISKDSLLNIQVLADDDHNGTLNVELTPNLPFNAKEFVTEWEKITGKPEGVQRLHFITQKEFIDGFRVELRAENNDIAQAAGEKFKAQLANIDGVGDTNDNLTPKQTRIHLTLSEQGRALGITSLYFSKQISQAFGGQVIQRFQRNKDEVWVRLRYPQHQRQSLADIMQAKIRTPDGSIVPLSMIANIEKQYQQDTITRVNNQKVVYLTAPINKSIIAPNEVVSYLQTNLVPQLKEQYPNLHIHFGGEAEQQRETMSSMNELFMLTLLAIYILLAIPLKSYIQPLLIMSIIPFGIIGAILGHWLNGITISLLSLFGMIALSGVVINDCLLLISKFNILNNSKKIDIKDAITLACSSRLRPILLTSITTFAGLTPLLAEKSVQAQYLIPAAASLAYGVLFSTVIMLLLIPALLLIQEDIRIACKHLSTLITR
ncbi:efflux RND transporter permease subunit [Shewanella surugensis]|uniref:Efflux RND transporter permease subunit n=1 Tax=Shewanella surugensis TaxID=212020 RepID=A0ABT0LFT6_9GAMM|nr:efflux RND transporter permease subunit [Shewanella surugensis]MCL1126572.1 efflux RND transporter permease subunit [Shewanella surugensis]